jgi:hypothetical protein
MPYDINDFVHDALVAKHSKDRIATALESAGWPADEVRTALAHYADTDFPLPVPRRKPYLSAKEAFTYLLLFTCLYISAWSFGSLLFDFINRWLPDPLNGYYDNLSSIRMATASLIITFPLYLWLSTAVHRWAAADPEQQSSKVRKWLTYVTLFVAAGTIIGDLIAVLYNLLEGELTLRFGLKVLVILGIAAGVFGYYLLDLRKEEKANAKN